MIGTAVCNARCWEQLRENAYLMGQMVDADTAYITSRGLRTLGVRLRQHHESSLKVAEWLAEHPQVARVNHPALPGSKGHEFWKRDFTGSSGLFSFVLKKKLNDEELANYLDNFSLFSMAYSWGGYESLILANQPEHIAAIRPQGEIDFSGTLIRLHIGLEDVDDLIADLDAGFARYLDNFSLFSMAYSWGGYESLILANQPEHIAAIRPQGEIDFSGTLIRLHIGLEDVDDLIADLDAGFARIV